MSEQSQVVYHAAYRCLLGDRRINEFMKAAGLGIEGLYHPVAYTVDWKPGVVVDNERAEKLCKVLEDGINASATDLACAKVELVSVYTTTGLESVSSQNRQPGNAKSSGITPSNEWG